jgi:hypothetical protein
MESPPTDHGPQAIDIYGGDIKFTTCLILSSVSFAIGAIIALLCYW